MLRHPSILKFDGLEDTSDGIWLATEQVTPLENVLEDLSAAEIVAGIYSVLEGLVFLHERVRWLSFLWSFELQFDTVVVFIKVK